MIFCLSRILIQQAVAVLWNPTYLLAHISDRNFPLGWDAHTVQTTLRTRSVVADSIDRHFWEVMTGVPSWQLGERRAYCHNNYYLFFTCFSWIFDSATICLNYKILNSGQVGENKLRLLNFNLRKNLHCGKKKERKKERKKLSQDKQRGPTV